MPSLRETQARIAQAILGHADVDNLIVADGLKPEQRIGIYCHHFRATLREALALNYPVVFRLVGEGFFNGMAAAFTSAHPPSQPCIAEYGDAFPEFIAEFEPAKSLPYLADVAVLEWLLIEAANAGAYDGKAFHSDYPVGRIWQSNQPGYEGEDSINLAEGGGWFVVEKIGDVVQWRVLDLPADAITEEEQK